MAENKTQATSLSTAACIGAIADDSRRADSEALLRLMAAATGQPAVMWGTAIVGFGVHRYPLAGGKEGEICAVGFASRKSELVLYGVAGTSGADGLLPQLGRHKLGKGCLYIKRLSEVDTQVLQTMVAQAFLARHAG